MYVHVYSINMRSILTMPIPTVHALYTYEAYRPTMPTRFNGPTSGHIGTQINRPEKSNMELIF